MLSSWRFLIPVSSSSSSTAAASPPPPTSIPSRTFLSPVSFRVSRTAAAHYSIRLRESHVDPRSESWSSEVAKSMEEPSPRPSPRKSPPPLDGRDDEDEGEISGIQVPRPRYVPVSKSQVLDAIVSTMFGSQEEKDQFLLMSSCLDSILHAEHKRILEEMRIDYPFGDPVKDCGTIDEGSSTSGENIADGGKESVSTRDHTVGIGSTERHGEETTDVSQTVSFNNGMDLRSPSILAKNVKTNSGSDSSRFQHAFMKLLLGARFEELSTRDLMLTSALNTDYLLTLPIYVDWNRASKSNAIIFRRGYTMEQQKGLLIVEKLDYIQSRILQRIFSITSKPLVKVFEGAFQTQQLEVWKKRIKSWLQRVTFLEQAYSHNEQTINNAEEMNQFSDDELPIWLAAQRAVSRYKWLLPPVGPRGRLLRRLLMWVGLLPTTPETSFELDTISSAAEPYSRPIFLPRISLSDIWKPARRKAFGNDVWKWLTTSISIFLSQSILQEPAFQELILLYTEEVSGSEPENEAKSPLLRLKIYEKISIPDLLVIFPHKKLSFRIIDTIRLDIATLLGLLAFFVNYKFEDILLSPSAALLDVIAITALVLYISRVFLGYKQTWDRYQLLVNKTLYEKTLASGFGVVHFLLDASEQQQYKEAILAYAILLKMEKCQDSCHQSVGDKCERFMYEIFKEKVEMPIERTVDTLKRLGLVIESETNHGSTRLQAVPCLEAYRALKHRWNSLLH